MACRFCASGLCRRYTRERARETGGGSAGVCGRRVLAGCGSDGEEGGGSDPRLLGGLCGTPTNESGERLSFPGARETA